MGGRRLSEIETSAGISGEQSRFDWISSQFASYDVLSLKSQRDHLGVAHRLQSILRMCFGN